MEIRMFKNFLRLLVATITLVAAFGTQAVDRSKPEEAVAMVKKAIAYIKANGKEKAFSEFNNPNGPFVQRDLYIVVNDLKGKTLAHGVNPRLIGKETYEMKDADGKQFVKDMVELAKTQGQGWVEYRFVNPATKQVEAKSAYIERIDDIYVICGIYKG
jgi:cytochrome c